METTKTPYVYADENGFVKCPYCFKIHRHGSNGNGVAEGHRQPDCGNEIGYIVIPYGTLHTANAIDWREFKRCFYSFYSLGHKTREELYEWIKRFLS